MNVLYLLKILDTKKLSELVANMDLAPIDMNLALWGAIDAGEIEIDEEKDQIIALKDAEFSFDFDLSNKLLQVIRHYAANNINITRGRLNSYIKDPTSGQGYQWHEYLMALQHLIDQGLVLEEVIDVPKTKKRPYHKFVFLGLPENDNQDWNAKAVNKWIADFEKAE